MLADLLITLAKIGVWLAFLLSVIPVMVWIERRASALMQDRRGPNRVGPFGLFQAIADAVKFFFKEDVIPTEVDRPLYLLVAEADTGVLLLLALASLGVYSLVMAGYSSNNKYSLLGSIRASSQMISYELALTLSVVAVLIPVESLRLDAVVSYQQGLWLGFLPRWNVFPQLIGFVVFLVAAFAETNRLPFDLSEAESELVAGYHTEYSSMKFALFFMGEYMSMTTLSALAATLYFGGWHLPGVDFSGWWPLAALKGLLILVFKVALFMFFFVWVRWTFPRFRFDQLLRLGWKVLLPVAVLNLVLVAAMTLAGWI